MYAKINKAKLLVFSLLFFGVIAAGCTQAKQQNDSQSKDQRVTQEYYAKLSEKVPYPLEQMNDSVERRNLREKLLRFNRPDKLGYIYLLSQTGEVIDFYTVKGKVSSTQSQMTTSNQVTYLCQVKPFLRPEDDPKRADNQVCEWANTPSPGDDGSYGENEQGIFWFDTNDVYHTWNGLYHYSDAPVKIDSVTHRMTGIEQGQGPTSVGESVEQRSK